MIALFLFWVHHPHGQLCDQTPYGLGPGESSVVLFAKNHGVPAASLNDGHLTLRFSPVSKTVSGSFIRDLDFLFKLADSLSGSKRVWDRLLRVI